MNKITSLSSQDVVAQNIETLKDLFPTIVKEGKIDFKELQSLLGEAIEDQEEYYRLTWAGKAQARLEANKPTTATLRPDKESSKDWDTTQNIFIEGDNLEVLKLLQKSYANRIKMIYIDPPYNTGKDFVYKDNYTDNLGNYLAITGQTDEAGNKTSTNTESDGRYHSNWLNMMYPRLRLARNLMTDDGVIFISIDDNEIHNLRKLCDEIFGEENFVGIFITKSTPNARDYGHIGKMHEYVLFYSKNNYFTTTEHLPDEDKKFAFNDGLGGYNIHPLYNSNEAFHKLNRPNLYYPFYLDKTNKNDEGFYNIYLEKKNENCLEIYPPKSVKNNVDFVWRWGKDKALVNLNKEIVGYETSSGEYRIVQKMRTSEKVIRSILDDKTITSRRGTAEVEEILEGKIFNFPKPLDLIYKFLRISTFQDDIILDFFAGSGTTSHAVMKLNSEDVNGSTRKCISVQLPEPTEESSEAFKAGYTNIAEITKERIRRAGDKIIEEQKELLTKTEKDLATENAKVIKDESVVEDLQSKIQNLKSKIQNLDIGFKAFKLDSSNIRAWDGNPQNLEEQLDMFEQNIKENRTEEDILFEILLKYGLDLTVPIEEKKVANTTVYNVGMGSLFVCLSDNITPKVSEEIGAWKEALQPAISRVIFKDTGFNEDKDKTNAIQILKRFGIEEVNSI